jgi:hypothetical protein
MFYEIRWMRWIGFEGAKSKKSSWGYKGVIVVVDEGEPRRLTFVTPIQTTQPLGLSLH